MARDKPAKRLFLELIERRRPERVTSALWNEMLAELAPISERYLRELVLKTGLPFDQPFAGVRQHTLEDLEQSLRELLDIYTEAVAAGDCDRARYCRRQVIAAKDRAKFTAARPGTDPGKKALKREMVDWMMVWLENPEVFPAWVEVRKKRMEPPINAG